MNSPILRILVIDDNPSDYKLIVHTLRSGGGNYEFERIETGEELDIALNAKSWDLIICDWSLPKFSAPDALRQLVRSGLDIPLVLVSGTVGDEIAAESIRSGAKDFILKERMTRLITVVPREISAREERLAQQKVRDALSKSEDKLRQSQKMEAIGRLAGGISHDINNMLQVVMSSCEMMLMDMSTENPARSPVNDIMTVTTQATALVGQLLAFSRKQVLLPKILNLNTIIKQSKPLLGRLIGENIDQSYDLSPQLSLVSVDPSQAEQVVLNLVINARDAMPTGGKLLVQTQNVLLDESFSINNAGITPGEYVVLNVSDTGTGMDKHTVSRIFEPFFTTKDVGKGTGLGLSTVFGIVDQSGGYLDVQSAVGHGTNFSVYFPALQAEDVAPQQELTSGEKPVVVTGTGTILIAEDDAIVRKTVCQVLRKYGYTVLESQTSGDAIVISELHQGKLDLLITDIMMPRMNGPVLASRLQMNRPQLKVLFMSGYADADLVQHGFTESGEAVLQKPFSLDVLVRRVHAMLSN